MHNDALSARVHHSLIIHAKVIHLRAGHIINFGVFWVEGAHRETKCSRPSRAHHATALDRFADANEYTEMNIR